MRGISPWPKQSPVLAACPRRKYSEHEPAIKADYRASEFVGVYTRDAEKPIIVREPPLHPSVLKVGRPFITPVLVESRIVFHRFPEVQAARDNAVWSFDAPGTLHVQREITDQAAVHRTKRAELERPHVCCTARGSQR